VLRHARWNALALGVVLAPALFLVPDWLVDGSSREAPFDLPLNAAVSLPALDAWAVVFLVLALLGVGFVLRPRQTRVPPASR
jgi:hypothetical protein